MKGIQKIKCSWEEEYDRKEDINLGSKSVGIIYRKQDP